MTSLELDLSPFLDQLVERIVDEVTERLAERLFGPLVPPTPAAPDPPRAPEPAPDPEPALVAPEPVTPEPAQPTEPPPARKQRTEGEQRTCEICGRKGTRRYVPVADLADDRWKCSPTATACSPQFKPPGKYTRPAVSDIPAETIPANVTAQAGKAVGLDLAAGMREHGEALRKQMAAEPAPSRAPGVTARCQDCTRTWTLTGRVLDMATETHELKHAHIVDVLVEATG